MRRLLNFIRRTIRALLLLVVLVYGVLYITLSIDAVQQYLRGEAETALSNLMHTDVRIGHVGFRPFNKLTLEDVSVPDQAGDTLFYAGKIAAGFSWLPLTQKKLTFTTVQLIGLKARLSRPEPEAPLNMQFLIDAFARQDSTPKRTFPFDLSISSVFLRRSSLSYDVASAPRHADRFDRNHVRLTDISGAISLRSFSADSLNLYLKRLSLSEQSGLQLNRLSFTLEANRQEAHVDDFRLQLPHTDLRFDSLGICYDGIADVRHLVDSAQIRVSITESTVTPCDVSAFAPGLRHFTTPMSLALEARGTINHLEMPSLALDADRELTLRTEATLTDITRPESTAIAGRVSRLELSPRGVLLLVNNFSPDTQEMPAALERLGDVCFHGDIAGRMDNLVAYGLLESRIGNIRTDVRLGKERTTKTFSLSGRVFSDGLETGLLFDSPDRLNHLAFALQVDLRKPAGRPLSGRLDGEISDFDLKGYPFNTLKLNGSMAGRSFDGQITLDDPNGYIAASGKVDMTSPRALFNLTASLRDVRPGAMHLLPKYPDLSLSLDLTANFTGNRFDEAQGMVSIDSLLLVNGEHRFDLDRLTVEADNNDMPQSIRVSSELISARISGRYNFATLPAEILALLSREALPVVAPVKKARTTAINDFDFELSLSPLAELSEVLALPFSTNRAIDISGHVSSSKGSAHLAGQLPDLSFGKMHFADALLQADLSADRAMMRLATQRIATNGTPLAIALNASADHGVLTSRLNWSNTGRITYSGSLAAETIFRRHASGQRAVRTDIHVLPTQLIINDSIWRLLPATVTIDSGRVVIDDFTIMHDAQHLKIDGAFSKLPTDTMRLTLSDISLDYIFEILDKEYIRFGGNGTGEFLISTVDGVPLISTDSLNVSGFTYNRVPLGDLTVRSEFDAKNLGIGLHGRITQPDARPTLIEGGIFPAQDSLWLNFKADRLRADFVDLWTSKILKDLSGRASGDLTLYGHFKELNLVGDAYTEGVSFGIEYLNTIYCVSDSMHFRTDGITFDNVGVFDRNHTEARASGRINYRNFKDITYDVSIAIPAGRPFLAFNVTEKLNPVYWGTVYASGSAHIYGDVEKTWIDVAGRSSANSHFTFSLNDNLTAGDYTFINFRDADKLLRHEVDDDAPHTLAFTDDELTAPADKQHEIYLNLQMEATPDVTIAIIMDPATGDQIKGNGSGNIRLEYSTATDFRLYGSYTIDKGSYFFNLQDVIMRDFTINQGSRINFRGDPLSAELDIKAIYQVTANLTELDESFAQSRELSRPTVPVQCILNIEGALRRPDLSFDINLPTVSDDVDRQVKNLIATDEMMNRQILYLMILGKFYTPDYVNSQGRYNELSSVASSTLSSQLNNLLGQISDNWNIGTNIRSDRGDFSDVEVELALSSQLLNNRLLFNGNLGYRDNPNASNSFVGDFDLEYLLNPAGSWRLKAYNHYNDRNYSVKSALTTQGVGILFKRDFNSFEALFKEFRRKKRSKENANEN